MLEISPMWCVIPYVVLLLGEPFFLRRFFVQGPDVENQANLALASLRYRAVCFGLTATCLWVLSPTTVALGKFGYPHDASDIQSTENLLQLLQMYNKALVQTADVVHWFIFMFASWLIASAQAIYCLRKQKDLT
jgi:hypothetical protein